MWNRSARGEHMVLVETLCSLYEYVHFVMVDVFVGQLGIEC